MPSVKQILDSLSSTFSSSNAKTKASSVTKDSITAQLEANKLELNSIHSVILGANRKTMISSLAKTMQLIDTDNATQKALGKDACKAIRSLPRVLSSTAQKNNGVFGAIDNGHKAIVRINIDLLNNLDSLLTEKDYVNIKNIRISHVLILGAIESTRMFCRFNSYLVAIMSHVNVGTPEKLPKYMVKFVTNNITSYIRLVNQITNTDAKYSIMNDIKNLRNNSIDVPALDGSGIPQSNMLSEVIGIDNPFMIAVEMAFGAIAWVGEVFVDMKHRHYQKLQDQKKWIEQHVANLELNISNSDPNDPEYLKLKKSIDYYNDKVTELDMNLDKYYKG